MYRVSTEMKYWSMVLVHTSYIFYFSVIVRVYILIHTYVSIIAKKTNCKVWGLKKLTKLYPRFLIEKKIGIFFILLQANALIIWLMTSPKSFEKIVILKTWQLVFFRGVKTYFGILPLK